MLLLLINLRQLYSSFLTTEMSNLFTQYVVLPTFFLPTLSTITHQESGLSVSGRKRNKDSRYSKNGSLFLSAKRKKRRTGKYLAAWRQKMKEMKEAAERGEIDNNTLNQQTNQTQVAPDDEAQGVPNDETQTGSQASSSFQANIELDSQVQSGPSSGTLSELDSQKQSELHSERSFQSNNQHQSSSSNQRLHQSSVRPANRINIQIENPPKQNLKEHKLTGRRIIDINYFFKQLLTLNSHPKPGCSLNDMVVIDEEKEGLESGFTFACTICGCQRTIWTEGPKSKCTDINSNIVSGMVNIECSYWNGHELFTEMNLPFLSLELFSSKCQALKVRMNEDNETEEIGDMEDIETDDSDDCEERMDVSENAEAIHKPEVQQVTGGILVDRSDDYMLPVEGSMHVEASHSVLSEGTSKTPSLDLTPIQHSENTSIFYCSDCFTDCSTVFQDQKTLLEHKELYCPKRIIITADPSAKSLKNKSESISKRLESNLKSLRSAILNKKKTLNRAAKTQFAIEETIKLKTKTKEQRAAEEEALEKAKSKEIKMPHSKRSLKIRQLRTISDFQNAETAIKNAIAYERFLEKTLEQAILQHQTALEEVAAALSKEKQTLTMISKLQKKLKRKEAVEKEKNCADFTPLVELKDNEPTVIIEPTTEMIIKVEPEDILEDADENREETAEYILASVPVGQEHTEDNNFSLPKTENVQTACMYNKC